jgi:nucleoside-diphosphate-sugar epimerase
LPSPAAVRRAAQKSDVAILGGTGFIGTHVVRRFLEEGRHVSVMARNLRNLPEPFAHARVSLRRGDIRDPEAVSAVVDGASTVINLAHGGGGDSPEEIADRMVGGAETVARACLAHGSPLLIHVGSTASLYLGPQAGKLTGSTPTDPRCDLRGGYARAKALAERTLLAMAASEGLQVCILRPGVVVGAGAAPLHGGLGFYNNEQHCIGWNSGRNPLPFVLVEDVAEAIWLASRAGVDVAGRCYNLVGDVRPSAREFIAMLAAAQQRPLCFHPQWPLVLWLAETGKWMVKRWSGRHVQRPARRDILSRGMRAAFDCTDAKRELGWRPVSSPLIFHRRAILVHRR